MGDSFLLFFSLRAPDANSDSRKILTAQAGNDGIHTLVSARAASLPKTNLAQGQVDVVMDDEEVVEGNLEFLHQQMHGLAARVHKGSRFGDDDFVAIYVASTHSGPTLLSVDMDALESSEAADAAKADIVACSSISLSGIAQSHDKFH